jgi:hypothetical protein
MKSKITFFNLGNADTTLIHVEDTGKNILWDYANVRTADKDDKRCDLPTALNAIVPGDYDVVCFTHADRDHIWRMSEYFYLEHDAKYQKGTRKKIKELWVPAAIFLDSVVNNDEDKILRSEARYRLKNGKGIRVFSKPDKLKDWLKKQGIDFEKVKHLIVDAGTFVPGWQKETDGVEFFVHSPFMGHVDDNEVVDRNESGIIAQAIFGNRPETKFILGADGHAETLRDIVKVTRLHNNHHRLLWDIYHLSHHCSYTALNGAEKGERKTIPLTEIKWLFETQGNQKCILISPSQEIEQKDTTQPPHFQAYNYYKDDVAAKKDGKIYVAMEFPTKKSPAPLVISIDDDGYKVVEALSEEEKLAGASVIASRSAVSGNWAI